MDEAGAGFDTVRREGALVLCVRVLLEELRDGKTPACPAHRVHGHPMLSPLFFIKCSKWGKNLLAESNLAP